MANIEKVIKGLYACTTFGENGATDGDCNICPYNKGYKTGECWIQMNRDALELLKEQQNVIEQYHKADSFLDVHGWKWSE